MTEPKLASFADSRLPCGLQAYAVPCVVEPVAVSCAVWEKDSRYAPPSTVPGVENVALDCVVLFEDPVAVSVVDDVWLPLVSQALTELFVAPAWAGET